MANIEEARLLLPWYATRALEPSDQVLVEKALHDSPLLQKELDEDVQMLTLVKQDPSVLNIAAVNTPDHRLDDLFVRIDEHESIRANHEKQLESVRQTGQNLLDSVKYWFSSLLSVNVLRYGMAAIAAVLVLQLIVMGSFEMVKPSDPKFVVSSIEDRDITVPLTEEQAKASLMDASLKGKTDIIISFEKNTPESVMVDVLGQYDLTILSHPAASTTYHVRLNTALKVSEFNALLKRLANTSSVSSALEGVYTGVKQ